MLSVSYQEATAASPAVLSVLSVSYQEATTSSPSVLSVFSVSHQGGNSSQPSSPICTQGITSVSRQQATRQSYLYSVYHPSEQITDSPAVLSVLSVSPQWTDNRQPSSPICTQCITSVNRQQTAQQSYLYSVYHLSEQTTDSPAVLSVLSVLPQWTDNRQPSSPICTQCITSVNRQQTAQQSYLYSVYHLSEQTTDSPAVLSVLSVLPQWTDNRQPSSPICTQCITSVNRQQTAQQSYLYSVYHLSEQTTDSPAVLSVLSRSHPGETC